jgi:tetratricopeptide (TPR) repeat protein
MLRYVSGRPPKVVKRKLKLSGGRLTEKERSLYLTYRQLARYAIVERLGEEQAANREIDKEQETRFMAEQLFKLLDRRRQRAHERKVQRALDLARAGRLDEALKIFDRMLTRDPFHQLRAKMAPFYLRRGHQFLEAGKLRRAARLFTKAIHLAGTGEVARTARARRALAEALASPGEDHQLWRLRAAVMHDPELGAARKALQQAERVQERRVVVVGAVGGGVSLALIIGLLFLRRRIL